MKKLLLAALVAASLFGVAACGPDLSPEQRAQAEAQARQQRIAREQRKVAAWIDFMKSCDNNAGIREINEGRYNTTIVCNNGMRKDIHY